MERRRRKKEGWRDGDRREGWRHEEGKRDREKIGIARRRRGKWRDGEIKRDIGAVRDMERQGGREEDANGEMKRQRNKREE